MADTISVVNRILPKKETAMIINDDIAHQGSRGNALALHVLTSITVLIIRKMHITT